ncbi:MAG TPA: hypothetical protein VI457_07515 [Methylococcaceae bacterium]|nr:hypothetical protein [Methylococcaceae bacterium]
MISQARAERKQKLALLEAAAPDCKCCGKPLKVFEFFDSQWAKDAGLVYGYKGEGVFCTLRCGYQFGILAVQAGYRAPAAKGGAA